MSLYETASRIGGLFVSNAANYSPMAFIENEDFYYDEQGLMVLTASYLKKRGHCCHSDCRHCPYTESSADNIPPEFNLCKEEDPYEKYIQMADEDQSDKSKDE